MTARNINFDLLKKKRKENWNINYVRGDNGFFHDAESGAEESAMKRLV